MNFYTIGYPSVNKLISKLYSDIIYIVKRGDFMSFNKRKNINTKLICTIISIIMILATIIVVVFGSKANKRREKEIATISQRYLAERKAEKEAEKEKEQIENFNVYEKLKEGRDINVIIIGDGIGASRGATSESAKWHNVLADNIKKKYKSSVTTTTINGENANVVRGWVELNRTDLSKKQDLAFICFGQNDNGRITSTQFAIFYESLIRKLKEHNPSIDIIPIIESSIRKDNAYTQVIKKLSEHYSFTYADTMTAFNNAKEGYESLSDDSILPNDKGYSYYARLFEECISKNLSSNKKIGNVETTLYQSSKLDTFSLNISPKSSDGFDKKEAFSTSTLESTLVFESDKDTLIAYYTTDPKGGKIKVYIDNEFVKEIDTYLTLSVTKAEIIAEGLTGKHEVKFQVSNLKGYNFDDGIVIFNGLVSN